MGNPVWSRSLARCEALTSATKTNQDESQLNAQAAIVTLLGCFTTVAPWALCLDARYEMRTGHLFAGAGGGILADLINGHEPVWAVEWDPYACQVLRERFPGLLVIEGDIRGVDFRELAPVDALCGGFPCQDISLAGKGGGITGERSGLYREFMRAINDIRPSWVFMENSPAIRTRGRHIVIGELVAAGYSWRDGILGAADVGAPHRRDRWWCLAHLSDADRLRQPQQEGRERNERGRFGDLGEEVADADKSGRNRGEPSDCGGMGNPAGLGLEIPQPSQAGDQQQAATGTGRGDGWWSTEPGMGRMAHGVANRSHRIKALGNGQVPLCAAVAWRILGGPVG
jgi:DNA (cytosine-5)-methyltransferase 1